MISLFFLVLSILLSALLDFSLTNTWQALVALPLIFGPLWIYGWKNTSGNKVKHPPLYYFGRFCLILFVGGYLLTVIAFFGGLM